MVFIEPLDLGYWFINTFSGDLVLFIIIAFMVITMLAARFRMSSIVMFSMFGIFLVMFYGALGLTLLQGLLIIAGVLLVFVLFSRMARLVK